MEKENICFKQIDIKQKLSQNTVNTILQDHLGFMWFGTQDGLNCFDGYNFRIYKKKLNDSLSLSENYVSKIYEDKNCNLWIGTAHSGLNLFDRDSDKFIFEESFDVLSNEYITSITEDNKNNLWVGTFNNGLYKFSKNKKTLEKIKFELMFDRDQVGYEHIISLHFDKIEEKLFVGLWKEGLFTVDLDSNLSKSFLEYKNVKSIISNTVIVVFKDSKSDIWIGTQKGLSRIDHKNEKIENYLHDPEIQNSISGNNITSVCEDNKGYIWIGTNGNGLSRYNRTENNFTNFKSEKDEDKGFISDSIMSLYLDKSEVLWIGTSGAGLLVSDSIQKKFFSIINQSQKSGERNNVRSINVINNHDIYIGTFKDGLYHYKKERENENFIKDSVIEKEAVNCIVNDHFGNLLIANEYGISKINPNDNTYHHFENLIETPEDTVFAISTIEEQPGKILIGTKGNGIKLFDLNCSKVTSINKFQNLQRFEVRSIFFDSKNHIWILSNNMGVFVSTNSIIGDSININTEYLKLSGDKKVWCLHEDFDNNIWLGTGSNGLNKIKQNTDTVIAYTEENGLCNNCIYGILEDDYNNLWLSTSHGLSMFNKENCEFKNYDISDGLGNEEFNENAFFKYKDGTMYFGGINGITYFHPSEIKDNPYIPNVVLTEFEIFNKKVDGSPDNPFLKKNITYADQINLTYRESVFSFRFASLIFNNPQKNQYAYKMENFDKDWTYCGTRNRVTYTNLNPGDYVFRVKGSNNDGVWNEEGTSIKINISPPYWKTVWFKGLGALSALSAMGYIYRQRIEKLEKEGKAQEEFSRKLIEAQEDHKKKIADDLHDTIAHEVLIFKQKAMMALKHKDDTGRMEKTLEEISELSSATITEVRNIAYNLHPHQLTRLGFTKTIKSIINEVSRATNITWTFETDDIDDLLPKEYEINLFRVVQETISNIIKHSQATEVILKVSKMEDHILILLIDNGKGMDMKGKQFIEAKNGFGISTIAERLKIMDGEVSIDSEVNKGTTLRFKIPIKNHNG